MIAVIVNTLAVLIGGLVGVLFQKGIPKKYTDEIMVAMGLCVLVIGIDGALGGGNMLVMVLSLAVGAALGSWIDIDRAMNRLGEAVERKLAPGAEQGSIARGFVTFSLLACVGAMAIVGSIKAGLSGDYVMLYTKSLLDMISAAMMAVSLGIGVSLASVCILVYEGAIVLLAQVLQPLLTQTIIGEMSCVGSVLILALGLNMLGLTKIKVANFLPAVAVAPFASWLFGLLGIG